MNQLVSVIVPVYNIDAYLAKSAATILSQTYSNIEILLIDDHSKDNSFSVMENLATQDDRVKIFRSDHHRGVSSARNFGIKKAKGTFISFVDGDDLLAPQFIESLIEQMNDETALATVGYQWGYRNAASSEKVQLLSRKEIFTAVNSFGSPIGGYIWNKLFRHAVLLDEKILFDEKIALAEDLWFTAEYIAKAPQATFSFLPQMLYQKVNRPTSTIHQASRDMRQMEQIIRRKIDTLGKQIKN